MPRAARAMAMLPFVVASGCGGASSDTDVVGPSSARCIVTATASTRAVPHAGGTATIAVSSSRECSWSARSDASWVTLAPAAGTGSATIQLAIAGNAQQAARTAHLSVNDSALDLLQEAAPAPPPPPPAPPPVVGTPNPTPPSPTPTPPRPSPTPTPPSPPAPPPPGPGAPTPGPSQPACSFELNRTSESFDARGGEGDVRVRTRDGCAWQARSGASWISITAGGNGSGNGELRYRVAENSSTGERSAELSVAGETFSVRQRGAEPPRPERVRVEGAATSVSGSCPSLSIGVRGEGVSTDSSTKFKHGACHHVAVGMRLTVSGERTGAGRIRADEIELDRR